MATEVYIGPYLEINKNNMIEVITSYVNVCGNKDCISFEIKMDSSYCPDCGEKCIKKEINKNKIISLYDLLVDIDKEDSLLEVELDEYPESIFWISNFISRENADEFIRDLKNLNPQTEIKLFIDNHKILLNFIKRLNIKYELKFGAIGINMCKSLIIIFKEEIK